MKNKFCLFVALAYAAMAMTGCNHADGGSYYESYELANDTEHVISIVHHPSCVQLPDSLVLQPHGSFFLEEGDASGNDFFDGEGSFEKRFVWFDGRYRLAIGDHLPLSLRFCDKNSPGWAKAMYGGCDVLYMFTYTFSEEDYRYAVAHGEEFPVAGE